MIVYDNRFEQIRYLAGGGEGLDVQGAMSEVVLINDKLDLSGKEYVLKRPMVSPGNILSPRMLQLQNDALIKETKAFEFIGGLRDQLSCAIPQLVKTGIDENNFKPHRYSYFITTKAPGKALSSFDAPIPLLAVFNIYANVIKCLKIFHENNILYNDTRHEHFFWDENIDPTAEKKESVTLIDFGNIYFLSGSNMRNLSFNETFENKSVKDDYFQLGQSLYRLLTGREIQRGERPEADLLLRREYMSVDQYINIVDFSRQCSQIILNLIQGNHQSASSIFTVWINIFAQNRKLELTNAEKSLKSYSNMSDLLRNVTKKYLIIGNPDLNLINRWQSHFDDLEYHRLLTNTKAEVNELISGHQWTRLLAGPLSKLFRFDTDLQAVLTPLIEILKKQDIVYDEQIAIIEKIIAHDLEAAVEILPSLINRNDILEMELRTSLLPFVDHVYGSQSIFQPSAKYPDFFFECQRINSPEQVLTNYKKLLEDQYGVVKKSDLTYLEMLISDLEKANRYWHSFLFTEADQQLADAIKKDILNKSLRDWRNACHSYRSCLQETRGVTGKIPIVNSFSNVYLEKVRNFELTVDQPYTDLKFIKVIDDKLLSLSGNAQIQNTLGQWSKDQKFELKHLCEEYVKQAFDQPNKEILEKITITDSELSLYLQENLIDWYNLCLCLFHLVDKQQEQDLDKLKENIYVYANSGSDQKRWELLKKGILYFQTRFDTHKFSSLKIDEVKTDFEKISLNLSKSDKGHWLYRLFVLGEQAEKADGFFRTPNYPKLVQEYESHSEEEKLEKPNLLMGIISARKIPTVISIGLGIIFSAIVFSVGTLFFSLRTPVIDTTPQKEETTEQIDTNCEQLLSDVSLSNYTHASEIIGNCMPNEDREEIIKKLIEQLHIDSRNLKYDPYILDVIRKAQNWNVNTPDDREMLTDLSYCFRYLELKTLGERTELYTAFEEMDHWVDFGPPDITHEYSSDWWTLTCGWDATDLIIQSKGLQLPYEGLVTVNDIDGGVEIELLPEAASTISYLPKSQRYYETSFTLSSGNIEQIIIQDKTIPDANKNIDTPDIYSMDNKNEYKIVVFWDYQFASAEFGYRVYANSEAVLALFNPQNTDLIGFAAEYGMTEDDIKRLNPNIQFPLSNPQQLIINSSVENYNNYSFMDENGKTWYQVDASSSSITPIDQAIISHAVYPSPLLTIISPEAVEVLPTLFKLNNVEVNNMQ